jgi:stage V sporulation protein T
MLDGLLKSFVEKVRDNSAAMLETLQESIDKERSETSSSKSVVEMLEHQMEDTRTEIKMLARQHVKDIAKHPEREEMLEEIYTEQIDELTLRLEGLRNQIQLAADKHNMIVNVNRTAKTVMEVFDAIINKKTLSKVDVDFIIERITVYEEHVDIKLRPDIDTLLKTGVLPEHSNEETAVNFKQGTGIYEQASKYAEITASNGRILSVNVISEGDPLEIYTNNDGEVIFRKYSAVSEMSENAGYVADIMHKIAGCPVVIFDKDHVVASAGVPRKEFAERRVTGQLEELMENRGQFFCPDGSTNNFFPAEGVNRTAIAALPIITAGDVSGAVAFLTSEKCKEVTDLQKSLINASAQFLARQIEG